MVTVVINSKKECCISSVDNGLTCETSLICCECLCSVKMEQILVHINDVSQSKMCPYFFISIVVQQKTQIQLYFQGYTLLLCRTVRIYLRIIIVCDINRPKWLVCIQKAENEKFKTNT
jgi:hypothetical protein